MRQKSKKNIEVEEYVDSYIKEHGVPPTYRMIEKHFNLSKCAAWNRCSKFREKMIGRHTPRPSKLARMKMDELRADFERRFLSKTMTKGQMQGAEAVWQWIEEKCGGF
jgi:SOS-response transcriptional repressor LexA